MKNFNCPESKKIIAFNDEKLADSETAQISNHLKSCESCSKKLQLLKKLDEVLFMENKKFKSSGSQYSRTEACIDDDLLYRYLDGRITESETEHIEKHLNICENCLNDLASIVSNSLTPATDAEQAEIARMRMITPETQVSKILEYCETPTDEGEKINLAAIIKKKVRQFFEKWIYTRQVWRPALSLAVLFVILVGVLPRMRTYIDARRISQAEKILSESYKVPKGDARLTGGFDPSGLGMLLAPNEKQSGYLEQAKSKINNTSQKNTNSQKARQILAKVYLINKQTSKADSIFSRIQAENEESASLLNDTGVLYFQKRNWQQAADYFQSAIEIDANLPEAYYNLALAQKNMNQYDDAISNLNKYLEIEHNENWRIFASQLRDEIKNNLEELK